MARIVAPAPVRRRLGAPIFLVAPEVLASSAKWAPLRYPPYDIHDHYSGHLPPGSPTGAPWLVWRGSRSEIFGAGGFGMDADGLWWMQPEPPGAFGTAPGGDVWAVGTKKADASTFLDDVEAFTHGVVLPTIAIVATAAATAVGGVAGIALGVAIAAALQIAQGGRVSEAVINSTREGLRSLVATGVFDETITRAKGLGLEQMYAYGKSLKVDDERMAFEQAKVLAISAVAQDDSLAEFKKGLDDTRAALVDQAAALQASPLDIANALGGEAAKVWMDQALKRNAGKGAPADAATTGAASLEHAAALATAATLPPSLQARALPPAETTFGRVAIGVGSAGAVSGIGWLARYLIRRMF